MTPAATSASQWVFHPRRSVEAATALARRLLVPLPVAHVLVNRGLDDEDKARRYLDPALENLHDPLEMLDLDRAAERILSAVGAGERILVQGDYDVDGITSAFLLHSALHELGARSSCRIPDRVRDGYGLTAEAVDEARRLGATLIVTVDCGITANEAVDYARARGIDCVVTDHHEPAAVLPEAAAVVNPRRPGCPYPFKDLAGVGVTFKLVERLLQGRGGLERAREWLDVVALGTIADVVPLVGENRILAHLGLDRLNQLHRPGLRALVERAGLGGRRITAGQVAFVLAPRINAAGRMGNAEQGLRLLLARDEQEAAACAEALEDDNTRRRQADGHALQEAERRVREELEPDAHSILLWSDSWHPGVIGIVASRLAERYARPTVLVAVQRDGGAEAAQGRGSCRSVPGLDLTRLLDGCTDLLVAHGGHAFAAGLTVDPARLPELRERFERLVREQQRPDAGPARLELDSDVRIAECDSDLVRWLERMAPHGLENPEPLFRIADARVRDVSVVGGGKHLRLRVADEDGEVDAIGFGLGDVAPKVRAAARVDLACLPTENEWNGRTRVQLKLKGVRLP